MKVSKVVLIVVALHVLVIGGIFIFEGCSRAKAPDTQASASDETQPADATNTAATSADTTTPAQNVAATQPTAPAPVVAPVEPAPASRSYVVKKGDTLWKIAKTEHVSMTELAKANSLTKTSRLKINQKLTIPAKAEAAPMQVASAQPSAATTADAPVAAAPGGSDYVVKSGDSLWKIAKAHNISVTALKQANSLTSDSLKVNQKLTIPAGQAPQTAQASAPAAAYSEWQPGTHTDGGQTFHIVDIGESPAAIAKKYNVAVSDLMKANNITDSKRILVGQKLVIPTAAVAVTSAPTPTPAVAAPIVSVTN